MKNPIIIESVINAPIEKVWSRWNEPEHITKWAFASADWTAPRATNDLKAGGNFITRMESRDGKEGFDFGGTYTKVKPNELIEYTIGGPDARKVRIEFTEVPGGVKIVETFEPENENPIEMQKGGWQSILDNFKKYVESN